MSELPSPIYNFVANSRQLPYPTQSARASIGGQFGSNGQYGYAPAGVPRFGHDPLTGICKGLLIEPATSFWDTFDSQYDRPGFSRIGCNTGDTFINTVTNTITQKVVEDTSTGEHLLRRIVSITSGQPVVMSMITSADERYRMLIRVLDQSNTSNGGGLYVNMNDVSGQKIVYGQGVVVKYSVYKTLSNSCIVNLSVQASTSVTSVICDILIQNSSGSLSYTGDGVSGIYISNIKIYAGSCFFSSLPTGWETTSSTSNNISTGSKTFTVAYDSTVAGQAIPTGVVVRVWQTSNPGSYLVGTVTSHNGTTISLNITATGGSGTGITDWTMQAGASVTRAGDVITTDLTLLRDGSGAAAWTGTGGTLVVQGWAAAGKPTGTAVQILAQIDDGTVSNRVRIYRNATGNLKCAVDTSGVNQVDLDLGVVADETEFKVGFSFAENAFCASLNGATPVSATSGTMPTGLVTRRHGCDSFGAQQWGGLLKLDQTYNRPLPTYLPSLSTL